MSVVDDIRKVFQDVIAPDLKAISVRLDELEKRMNLRFEHAEEVTEERFKQTEERFKQIDARLKQSEDMAQARHETTLSKVELATTIIATNLEALRKTMDLERRMERIELGQSARLDETRKS